MANLKRESHASLVTIKLALVRDDRKVLLLQKQQPIKPSIYLYTSSGKLMETIQVTAPIRHERFFASMATFIQVTALLLTFHRVYISIVGQGTYCWNGMDRHGEFALHSGGRHSPHVQHSGRIHTVFAWQGTHYSVSAYRVMPRVSFGHQNCTSCC